MTVAAFALCYAGFALLGLSQARHQERAYGGERRPRRPWGRWAGWTLLGCGALASAAAWGPGTGVVAFLGMATFAAVAVALLLTYAPRIVLRTAAAAVCVAVAVAGLALAT
ncbi:MAG: DUF3325 domain-containing protein [Acidobacteria bacterium]|nr:DUF3325 domain-containing protein [Acidobacteriota bacterium]